MTNRNDLLSVLIVLEMLHVDAIISSEAIVDGGEAETTTDGVTQLSKWRLSASDQHSRWRANEKLPLDSRGLGVMTETYKGKADEDIVPAEGLDEEAAAVNARADGNRVHDQKQDHDRVHALPVGTHLGGVVTSKDERERWEEGKERR